MLIAIAVSFLSGITRTVSRMVNAQLSERIGPFQSTFYNYVLGLICSVLILLLSREPLPVSALTSGQIPAWAYFGGVVGVLFVVLSNLTAPKISAFSMTLLIFVGQIATGIAIDVFVHQQFSLGKIAGGALILAGLLGNLSIDEDRKRIGPSSPAHVTPS
jgi:bacterial/archaeal transporter family-2 protein